MIEPLVEPLVSINTFSLECIGPGIQGLGGDNLMNAATRIFPVANMAIFIPFVACKPFTIARLMVYNGGVINGNFDIGVYDESGYLLRSTGSTAQAGAINLVQFVDVADMRIGPGVFYLAMSADDIVGQYMSTTIGDIISGGFLGLAEMAAAFPLPAVAVFATRTDGFIPVIGLTTRTV